MSFDEVPDGIDNEITKLEEVSFKEFENTKAEPVKVVEETVKVVKKDPFEEVKQKLRDEQENEYANPDKIYVTMKIPIGQKVGDKCTIKFSDEVPKAQVAVSQNISWAKRDKYDKASKPELISKAFILDEHKAKGDKMLKEVSFMWEDLGIIAQETRNLLKAGEYLVEVRAWNTGAGQETTVRRLVTIS